VYQIGNPGLFAIGDPSIFLLGHQYWLQKWLPDPPPEARDAMFLSHLYALSSTITDSTIRAAVQQPIATQLTALLAAAAAPPAQPAC
jgi:hypothetical protein